MSFYVPDIYVVTFATTPADTPARRLTNPAALLNPAPQPFENRRLPKTPGRLPREAEPDESEPFELVWEIDGRTGDDGEPFSDPRAGLIYNYEAFKADIYRAPRTGAAVPVAMDSGFDGVAYTGQIQFRSCRIGKGLYGAEVRVLAVLPFGELVLVGSA